MKNKPIQSTLWFVIGIMMCAQSQAQQTGSNQLLDLQKPVTIHQNNIPIGLLIQEVSNSTGVRLRMDDSSQDSGILVMASLKDVPLKNFLYASASLLGYRTSPWRWVSYTTKTGKTGYWLTPSRSAQEQASQISDAVTEEYIDTCNQIFNIFQLPPKQLKAQLKKMYSKSNPNLMTLIGMGFSLKDGLLLANIDKTVGSHQMSSLLQGKKSISLLLNQGNPPLYTELNRNILQDKRIDQDSTLTLTTTGTNSDDPNPHPKIVAVISSGHTPLSATYFLRVIHPFANINDRIWSLWMQPNDHYHNPFENNLLILNVPDKIDTNNPNALHVGVHQYSLMRGITNYIYDWRKATFPPNMLAVQPGHDLKSSFHFRLNPPGKVKYTLGSILHSLATEFSMSILFYKWHDGILEIQYPSSYLNLLHAIPLDTRQEISSFLDKKPFSFNEFANLLRPINKLERTDIAELLKSYGITSFGVLDWMIVDHPGLLSTEGKSLNADLIKEYMQNPLMYPIDTSSVTRIRVVFDSLGSEVSTLNPTRKQLPHAELQVLDKSGLWHNM